MGNTLKKIKNNLEKQIGCPICKLKTLQKIKYKDMDLIIKGINIHECQYCKTVYSAPRTKKNKIQYLYTKEVTDFYEKEQGLISGVPSTTKNQINFRHIRLKKLIRNWIKAKYIKKQDKVLDYGCGDGLLVKTLSGFKIVANGADFSVNKENEVIKSYNDLKKDKTKYDVIILRHVLEHAYSPNNLLLEVSKYLKPNGHFIIEVPNEKCFLYRFFGKYYDQSNPIFHIFFFNKNNIENIIPNFKVKKISFNKTAWFSTTFARLLGIPLKPYGLVHAIGFIMQMPFDLLMREKNALVLIVKKN